MEFSFKKWLEVGNQLTPPLEDPTKVGRGAFADYCGTSEADPQNPEGKLPPINKKRFKKKKSNLTK